MDTTFRVSVRMDLRVGIWEGPRRVYEDGSRTRHFHYEVFLLGSDLRAFRVGPGTWSRGPAIRICPPEGFPSHEAARKAGEAAARDFAAQTRRPRATMEKRQ